MQYATLLLNKIVEDGNTDALKRHNVTIDDMHSKVDRDTYEFITEYAEQNAGAAPSYAVVAASVEGFDYIPQVSDNYTYLARKLKDYSAQQAVVGWFKRGEFEAKLNELGGERFLNEWLAKEVAAIQQKTAVRTTVGTDVKKDTDKFMAEYDRRKAGESFRLWKSRFSAVGEYVSSNLYTVFGKSGRGKSVTSLEDGIYAAMQGANVLIWALEMGLYEVLVRIYVSMSGTAGIINANIEGESMAGGFDSRSVRLGQLSDEFEDAFRTFISTLNEDIAGNITIRAVDDEDFTRRNLDALESDIKQTNADFVIVDPFYFLEYEKNTSKTAGGDASATSMKLRRIAGQTGTVIIAITQADEGGQNDDEDGNRELVLPGRSDVKKTMQLLEDAYQLIAVDTDYKQGRGIVGVGKGRDGGEGNVSEILYIPNCGIVREMETGGDSFDDFEP